MAHEEFEQDPNRFNNRGGELEKRLNRDRLVNQKLLPAVEQEIAKAMIRYKEVYKIFCFFVYCKDQILVSLVSLKEFCLDVSGGLSYRRGRASRMDQLEEDEPHGEQGIRGTTSKDAEATHPRTSTPRYSSRFASHF